MTENSISNEPTMRNHHSEPLSMGNMPTERPVSSILGMIDRYELLSELGGGGFGSVYLARDTVAGVLVAVKGLPPMVKNIPEELERIRANFALVSQLSHSRIASLKVLHLTQHAAYNDRSVKERLRVMPGDYLVVMEFAKGVTLSQWKRQFTDGRVPYELAVEICRQIGEALDYAHTQKIAHRDIKPSNVMVESFGEVRECENARVLKCGKSVCPPVSGGRKGAAGNSSSLIPYPSSLQIKVLDFGLAAEIRSSMSRVSQEKCDASGTRPYMAPEQWAGRKQGAATDQYALAVLFYELVSGGVPFASAFDTGDPVVMSNAVLNLKPELVAGVSKKVNAALLRGLAKEPGERFGSCGELVAALGGKKIIIHKRSQRAQRKRVVVALVVVGLVSIASIFSINSIRSNKDAAAVRAEQAQLDVAKQAQVKSFKDQIEGALSAGDLKVAGAGIAELEKLAGATIAKALSERYQGLAGERETNKRYAEASVKRESVQKLERGQGFGARLDALEIRWREAEAARQGSAWGQALSCYDAVLEECKVLDALELSRGGAEAQRDEAAKAKSIAEASNANTDAPELWPQGVELALRAKSEYEKGIFPEAKATWKQSAEAYAAAKIHAVNVQGYQKAKAAYEAELGGQDSVSAVLLATHGRAKWSAVKQKAQQGAASSGDPTEGAKAYAAALAALPAALTEAQSIKTQFEEGQRIKKAAAEMAERVEAVENALAAAGAAKTAGNWAQVKELLTSLETAPAVVGAKSTELTAAVKALLDEAVANLEPTLTLIAEAGGREIIATVTDSGGKAHTTPQTFTLKPDAHYVFIVSIPSNQSNTSTSSKRYQPATLEFTADWRGAQTRRVTLEELVGPVPGSKWSVDLGSGVAMDFMPIAAGSFQMGSENGNPDGKPVHRVTLTKPFWMGRTEVTQGEYEKVMGDNPSYFKGSANPVETVSWTKAVEFCQKLTERERAAGRLPVGYEYRLPTEAEWEYCCRAGTTGDYAGTLDSMAWYDKNSEKKTHSVASKSANSWGLYDMHGNVWEWCLDDWHNSYNGAPSDGVRWGVGSGPGRVARGGSWHDSSSFCRSAFRFGFSPTYAVRNLGFRSCLARK